MMRRLGLKLWSTNTGPLLAAARGLYARRTFDYLELFVVPGSLGALADWRRLRDETGLPFVIHNAHAAQGFNLAIRSAETRNRELAAEARAYADALDARQIIFHGGMDGTLEEAVRQLKALGEGRALVENKPFVPLPNAQGLTVCRGATRFELERILRETGCGFCLDIGHAFCSAASQGREPYGFVRELAERLHPVLFHLSDVADFASPYDAHPHLGTGRLDLVRLGREAFGSSPAISIETVKDSPTDLDDFARDVEILSKALDAASRPIMV